MITTQTNPGFARRGAGFSMIDVLVAIVVLATALLALAALQGAMTRNSADARARSQIAAYSEGLIDQMRSSGTLASATITPSNAGGATELQKDAYRVQNAAGVTNLQTVVTATDYYGSVLGTGGTFTTTVPTNYAGNSAYYQRVNVATSWTDATGQSRTLSVDAAVSPLSISGDNSLSSQSLQILGSATPVVREYNPGATAGVIPIAVGSSQQTAATNPKPELLALNGNNTAVVGTSFNVLTYQSPDSNNETVIQQRIDTLVVACSCKYGGSVSSDGNSGLTGVLSQPYRPTYWDGAQYVEPTPVSGTTTSSTSSTGVDTTATQSPYCDICCRDHNDASTDEIKFDPWNTTGDFSHYRYDSTNTLVAVGPSDTNAYMNACRLIRVNGRYSVATDLNDYFFGLLATATPNPTSSAAKSPNPDSLDTVDFGTGGAVAQYKAFVLDYLQTNVDQFTANTIPSVATAAADYAASPYNLDVPSNIGITYSSSSTDYRYLHARGLYIDYLEPAAVTAIDNAVATCTSSTVSDCYLPILPFTTINLSEIANWSVTTMSPNCSSPTTAVTVNNQQIVNETFNASRGVVTARSCAHASETPTVKAAIGNSNSGIAATGTGFANPVDPDDASSANSQSDTQQFTITSTQVGGGGNVGATLYLLPASPNNVLPQLSTGYQSTYPSISWQLDSVTAPFGSLTSCSASASGNGKNTKLNSYTCPSIVTQNPTPTGVTITVKLQNYNYAYTATADNPCWSGHTTSVQYCSNFAIDTGNVKVNGTTVSANASYTNEGNVGNTTLGTTAEQATVTIANQSMNGSNTISIGFELQSNEMTSYTCTGNNNQTATFAACN